MQPIRPARGSNRFTWRRSSPPGMDMPMRVWNARASMLSTVAVGTDGSATASEAVEVAAQVAERFDAKLVLLSACQKSPQAVSLGGSSEELQWAGNNDA